MNDNTSLIGKIKNIFIKDETKTEPENKTNSAENNVKNKAPKSRDAEKMNINKIVFALSIAMALLFLGKNNNKNMSNYEKEIQEIAKKEPSNYDIFSASNYSYKNYEEERIKNFIMAYDGVEDAKVLLSVKSGKEKILAYETDENSDLSDSKGEESNIDKSESKKKEVIRDSDDNPYIIMENEPTFKGVIILVKGNVSTNTINEIRESMKAYLHIGLNNIKVYKMKV